MDSSNSERSPQEEPFKMPKSKKRGRPSKSSQPTTPSTSNPVTPTKSPTLKKTNVNPLEEHIQQTLQQQNPTPTTSSLTNTYEHPLPLLKHNYIILTPPTTTRIQLATLWEKYNTNNQDILIKQKDNFVLKTNEETKAKKTLETLLEQKLITKFHTQAHQVNQTRQLFTTNKNPPPSYSVIVNGVEPEVTNEIFENHLKTLQYNVRYCKRINSRERQKPTLMIRLITGDLTTFEKLISARGIYFLGRIYRITESRPPPPIPAPCGRCNQYDHTTENCPNNIKCSKCLGPHHTNACKTTLPVQCTACNSDSHVAWSVKCPKRPTAPIEGIPNVKVKCTNKTSIELDTKTTSNSRIHTAITIHDFILNKIKNELNKANRNNREALLKKLRRRFVDDFQVDINVVFFANHIYILMFDMLRLDRISPTEPKERLRQTITNVDSDNHD